MGRVHASSWYMSYMRSRYFVHFNYTIDVPKPKPVLLSAAKTTSFTGLKICKCTVLTMSSDQKAFSQPCHKYNFLYQDMHPTGFTLVHVSGKTSNSLFGLPSFNYDSMNTTATISLQSQLVWWTCTSYISRQCALVHCEVMKYGIQIKLLKWITEEYLQM